ncbi:hypothetical protein [Thermomonas carbonis]|uniref:O-antigen ligase family protein n=1 Tax=Thermomonas carbonis TaxID=1463158 RepID=A0A7G9SN48_9GAMM|nr:hypothetical protein [Thermomonas carbonis]QNN69273.1 hypothetical protein H9L16_11380 [Thermomonas carbonis]GHC05568.1 hypothetical protein GCM10010080_19270 [Thermomonas carbonis]
MALYVLLGLAALFSLRAVTAWRYGFFLMILLAAVQDPLRKLVPGTPGWLVLITAPVFLATVLGAVLRTRGWWPLFKRAYPQVGNALLMLILLCVPAAILSATYGPGSWMLTVLGAFSYASIFLAVITGFHFPRDPKSVRKLLVVYCLAHGVMLSGAVLEYYEVFPAMQVIGTKAMGFEWMRWGSGYTVDMLAGFYRSPDVMGWHAAAVCMLSLVLGLAGKGKGRWGWIALSGLAIIALMLCGRRKMVYMLPVFLLALVWIYWQAGRAGRMVAMLGLLLIPVGSVWLVSDQLSEESANVRYYSGEGLKFSAMESIQGQGFGAVVETYKQSGVLGEGLGVATPGSHNLKVARPRVWQESAPSRIMVELGVPGTLGFLLVMIGIVLALWRTTIKQLRTRSQSAPYAAGLFAFFLANVGSLTVSGQILADPFIAAFLGILVGVVLSLVRFQAPKANGPSRAV